MLENSAERRAVVKCTTFFLDALSSTPLPDSEKTNLLEVRWELVNDLLTRGSRACLGDTWHARQGGLEAVGALMPYLSGEHLQKARPRIIKALFGLLRGLPEHAVEVNGKIQQLLLEVIGFARKKGVFCAVDKSQCLAFGYIDRALMQVTRQFGQNVSKHMLHRLHKDTHQRNSWTKERLPTLLSCLPLSIFTQEVASVYVIQLCFA